MFTLATGRIHKEPPMTLLCVMAAKAVARSTVRAVLAASTMKNGEHEWPAASDLTAP